MRRASLALMALLPLALVALGLVAWQRLANPSYDELVLPGAGGLRVERVSWQLTKISYSVPPPPSGHGAEQALQIAGRPRPSRAAALVLQQRLLEGGWVRMEGAERTGPTLFEFGMTRTRYTRSLFLGMASESVLLVGYDGPPVDMSISVTRALHRPRLPSWLRALWR